MFISRLSTQDQKMSCWVSKWLWRDSAARLAPQMSQSTQQRFTVVVLPACRLVYFASVWETRIFPGMQIMTFVLFTFARRLICSNSLMRMSKDDCSHSRHLAETNPPFTKKQCNDCKQHPQLPPKRLCLPSPDGATPK